MLIERKNNDQIVITFFSSIDSFGLQRVVGYVKYLEATFKRKAKQSDVDKLADEITLHGGLKIANALLYEINSRCQYGLWRHS